jgi:Protein of unknown function (DUF1549)/Protein of unknown function (DUF1553)
MRLVLPSHHWASVLLFLVTLGMLASPAAAQTPLHQRIDELIAADTPGFSKLAAPPASDEEFLRRVYLDLTGTVPTPAEARAFFKDTAPDRRARLIDRLLASPEHARHLTHVFDVLLMERRQGRAVPAAVWQQYLYSSFLANKPWDQLAREILTADGSDTKNRGPARFYLERKGEPNEIVRDVSRLFLGTNLHCAQCHDHPLVPDYKQDHYYGLFAFFNRSYPVTDKKLKMAVLGEKAEGEVSYQSVFDPAKVTKTSLPRVPGRPAIKEPKPVKGKEYIVKPAKTVRGVPTYSRRALLGPELARADDPAFCRNIANRMWALMMGRGLVHPLDMDHSANPPSHPELLALLAAEVAAHKFDLRWLLRELALSKTYQRSSIPPPGAGEVPAESFAVAAIKPLTPEALAFSLHQATGMTDLDRAALGKKLTETGLYARVSRQVAPLVTTFAGEAGEPEEFEPTLAQALFLANGPMLRGWLTPRGNNLTARLGKLTDPAAAAEEAYLSVFIRRPTAEEKKELAGYLKAREKDRAIALQEYLWALLTSAEFRFNH